MRGRTLVSALLLLSCGSDQTAIVIEAVSQLPAGALDEVVFRVNGPGFDGGSREANARLDGPGAKTFPLTLVLVQGESPSGPFAVSIDGRKAGAAMAQGIAVDGASSLAFVPHTVVHHRFVLVPLGSPAMLPPGTATDGPPPMSLPPDAGVAVEPDAAPVTPDAAPPPPSSCPTSAVLCGKDRCTCALGCACNFGCGGDKCEVSCLGTGTTCQVDFTAAKMANVTCAAGATCVLQSGPGKHDVKVMCSAASCDLTCPAEGCDLNCAAGSSCLLRCADESCKLQCPPGLLKMCPNGVQACNRDCP
jgi:hypothetical protein